MKNISCLVFSLLTIYYSATAQSIPSAESVGLIHVVPDMLLWYSTNNYLTNGPITVGAAAPNATIWDAYVSVLGDSTFLIANVTYATNTYYYGATAGQVDLCDALAFQPAAGGSPKLGYEFWDDSGKPYLRTISSRKNGSPGRVAADKRYGATNFITGSSISAGATAYTGPTAFQSNARWSNSAYQTSTRYNVEQIFSLNPATLAQTPRTLASDFLNTPPVAGQTVFGDLLALSDGNFAIIGDDQSHDYMTTEGATVAIVKPDGTVVTPTFAVNPAGGQGIWGNAAAYNGGFCVRFMATLYFYDNAGTLLGTDSQTSSGLTFGTDRGDRTRIASDIHSDYVYLAGVAPSGTGGSPATGSPVYLAVWDANTRAFVTAANVSCDIAPAAMTVNAVNLGVNGLDQITVGWDCKPNANFSQYQVVTRVLRFDGANISYLTPSFFPFVNYDPIGTNTAAGFQTQTPGIGMTTNQICISCKGIVNSTNNPAGGPDTPPYDNASTGGIDLYTVISLQPTMTVQQSGSNLIISWGQAAGLFTLESATTVTTPRPWPTVSPQPAIVGPVNGLYSMTVPLGSGNKFFVLAR